MAKGVWHIEIPDLKGYRLLMRADVPAVKSAFQIHDTLLPIEYRLGIFAQSSETQAHRRP